MDLFFLHLYIKFSLSLPPFVLSHPLLQIQDAIHTISNHFSTKQQDVGSLYSCYGYYSAEVGKFMKFLSQAQATRWSELCAIDPASLTNGQLMNHMLHILLLSVEFVLIIFLCHFLFLLEIFFLFV